MRTKDDFINDLGVQDGKIGVESEKVAAWIASKYLQLNNEYFRKPEHIFANIKFSELITLGLEICILAKAALIRI